MRSRCCAGAASPAIDPKAFPDYYAYAQRVAQAPAAAAAMARERISLDTYKA